jgi:hypothetical protein
MNQIQIEVKARSIMAMAMAMGIAAHYEDGSPLRRVSRLRRPGIFTFSLLGMLAAYGAGVIGADAVADTSSGSLSFHAGIGGQNAVPGGTYALGQQTSAMSLMFERTDLWDDFGLALRYLNEGYLGPQNAPAPQLLSSPLHYKDAFALLLTRWPDGVMSQGDCPSNLLQPDPSGPTGYMFLRASALIWLTRSSMKPTTAARKSICSLATAFASR